jgi:tetratricopeptide (TPR) repeat protein
MRNIGRYIFVGALASGLGMTALAVPASAPEAPANSLPKGETGASTIEYMTDYMAALKKKSESLEMKEALLIDQVDRYRKELALARQQITDLKAVVATLEQEGTLPQLPSAAEAVELGNTVAEPCPWADLVAGLTGESRELLQSLTHEGGVQPRSLRTRKQALERERSDLLLPRQVALPSNSPQLAAALTDVALSLQEAGQPIEAEGHFAWAVMVLQSTPLRNHLATGIALENLGSHYLGEGSGITGQGSGRGAEAAYRLALGEYRYVLPPDHPKLASLQNRMASALQRQGRMGEAEAMYLTAVDTFTQRGGASHLNLVAPAHNLAKLYIELDRCQEASWWLERAQKIVETHADADRYAVYLTQTASALMAREALVSSEAGNAAAEGIALPGL